VALCGVRKVFGATIAVDDVSLEVERGSFTTLLGPSGCGKTTTLRLVAGFFDPDVGEVRIGGVRQNGVPPNLRNVSIVFQDYALFPHMTVLQNVGYGLRLRRVAATERTERVGRVLELLGLEGLERRYPFELSGGQQQRVALGRSLVMEPDVLLMDEPLSNLDAKLRVRVRSELKAIQRATGITTIYVTHDQDEALSLSDRIAVMADGRLQQVSDPWELYHAPVNRFVADFVGTANVLPAQVVARRGTTCQVVVPLPQRPLRFSCRDPRGLGVVGEAAAVMLRPEWWTLREGDAEPHGVDEVAGTVSARAFQGAFARVWVRVPGLEEELMIDAPLTARDQFAPGAAVSLHVGAVEPILVADR